MFLFKKAQNEFVLSGVGWKLRIFLPDDFFFIYKELRIFTNGAECKKSPKMYAKKKKNAVIVTVKHVDCISNRIRLLKLVFCVTF